MRRRKGLALFLAVAMVFCYMPGAAFADEAASGVTFADMPSDWSTTALENAVANGLISGYDDANGTKLIKPTGNLTRAEMATIVNRAFGATETAALTGVGDVASDAWYAADMAKAVKMGTFKSDSQMRPNDSITRQEAFTVLARAFKVSDAGSSALSGFADKGSIASWASGGISGLVAGGYVAGSGGMLNPTASITRAEFAKIMDNMLKVYITKAETVKTVAAGNVMVNVPGVTLDGVTINGNLIIGDGVGNGNVTLNNVKVTGETIVRGGGVNSIIIKGNSDVGNVVIAKVDGNVRVAVEGDAKVEVIYIDDGKDDVVIEGKVGTVEVAASDVPVKVQNAEVGEISVTAENASLTVAKDSTVTTLKVAKEAEKASIEVAGTVKTVDVSAPKAALVAADGAKIDSVKISETATGATTEAKKGSTITTVETKAEGAAVKGEGTVKTVDVKGDNTSVDTKGTAVNVDKGVDGTKAGGKDVAGGESTKSDGTTPATGGGGGGGGGGTATVNTAVVRPAGPAGDTANFDYLAAYTAAGVSVTPGTNKNTNTATINVTPANKTAIASEMLHDTIAYVGLQFTKPNNAARASVTIGTETADVDLTTDGASVHNGQYIEYFAVYDASGNTLADMTWSVSIVWKDADGATLTTTAYTVKRVDKTLDSIIENVGTRPAVTAIPGGDLDALETSGWTGMPEPPTMTLDYAVDPIAKKVNATGELGYASGFTGFGSGGLENGYYPAFRIAIPNNIATVVNGSEGTVMTITGATVKTFDKGTQEAPLIEGAAGNYYIDVIMHRTAPNTNFEVTFDWDGDGLAYRTTVYEFVLSEVGCLITESDITGDVTSPTKAQLAAYLNAMFTFKGSGTIAWNNTTDTLTVTGYTVAHDKDSESDTTTSAWTIWTGRIMDGFNLDLSGATAFILAPDSWLHVQSAATLTLPADAKITLNNGIITKDGTNIAWGYKVNGTPKYFDVIKGSLPGYSYEEGVTGYPASIATAAIAGVTAPVTGATPVDTITETSEYTATIAWNGAPITFAGETVYTATIIITPKSGYTLTGVAENFFTVAGATTTNEAGSGEVTAVFPATAAE